MAAVPASSPLTAHTSLAAGRPALLLATSRSAVVRLAPVADALTALGAPQAAVDLPSGALCGGRVLALADDGRADLAPAAVAAATEGAIAAGRPAAVLVAGDSAAAVTSALVARRLGVPIARLGAGARCGDESLPEEINRLALDALADRLYADGADAAERLRAEGVAEHSIACVGSTLADAVAGARRAAARRAAWRELGLPRGGYVLVALHRAENLGDDTRVARIAEALAALAGRTPVALCL